MSDGYRSDLAFIHDTGYGGFARRAAPHLLALLRRSIRRRDLVVDLGCGSGIWARALCAAGYDVLGIDQSEAMIALARVRAPRAEFLAASFLDVELPPCAAVTSLGECFSYLFDRSNSTRRLAQLFRRIHTALVPGGWLIFDVAGPGRGSHQGHREGKDWAVLVTTEEQRRRRRLTRRITSFRRVGELYRRDHEVHHLRLYSRTELATMLRDQGFRVRTLSGFGRLRFVKGHVGFLARKV
jgi:SAM-dependent methyltransferase